MSTPEPLWRSLPELARRLRQASTLAVACDFDGTLTEIVEHERLAELPRRARRALESLVEQPGVHLGFFSGRRVIDLVERVRTEPAWYSGVCGLEARDHEGVRCDPAIESDGVPAALVESLCDWCDTHPGTWMQDKGRAIAVHYRQLPARLQAAFVAGVRRRAQRYFDRIQAEPGKRVVEISPVVALGKGWALDHWLTRLPGAPCVIYMGDDVNDERAYPFVRARGGISVAVARRASAAQFGIGSTIEVTWWLEWLSREWAEVRFERQSALG